MNMMRPLLLLLALVGACAPAAQPAALAPPEIPALIAQAQREPRNAALRFRLAAALAAARRCDTAVAVARTAQLLEPDNVRGPLVVGSCQEQGGRYDAAIATYSDFAAQHATARGVAALRAKAQLALRASAEQTARQALAREAELAQQPPQSATVAVLPVLVSGDSTYQPLSRGLAELITTDLAYIRTLRLLERLQIGVLLDELKLGASDRADPATAARVGKLLRAERMVQGVATIPPGGAGAGSVQLTASVVTGSGVVRSVAPATGPFSRLLALEKQVVFGLAAQLGIQLTEAERQRILKEGPRNLAAFLAYSSGLEAMDGGDYAGAARQFGEATRADPSFRAAAEDRQAAAAAPALRQAGADPIGSIAAVDALGQAAAAVLPATGGLLSAGTLDVAPTAGDAIAQAGGVATGTTTTIRRLVPETAGLPSIISVTNGITIIFKRPP
ncbi:MAG: hypothetical protein AUH45_06560 [Gemmatimonadetes bacterium 13_1_40CM_69_22]|nr:MAG: hypothetical protein AUH45_06560 [Gemmatimonadetes bacterium 13_1_40CM_69_22]